MVYTLCVQKTDLITEAQFQEMMPNAGARLDAHWPYINPALDVAEISTPLRISAFLAQLAHESGEFHYMQELADGSAYEGRADLGNTEPGDGVRYKGRGPIQITGRANYAACGKALGLDLIGNPKLLEEPEYGTLSATWFWDSKHLSLLADHGWFRAITRAVNGGYTGWADRLQYYEENRRILGLLPYDQDREGESIFDFQQAHGLAADGIVGAQTMKALQA